MSSHACTGNPCWLCYPPAIPAGPYTTLSPPPKGGPPREHELKTHPGPFQALVDGLKPFEIRRNDRGYQEGDRLRLREWNPEVGRYTGRELRRDVVYVLAGGQFGIRRGFVAMGLRSPSIEGARETASERSWTLRLNEYQRNNLLLLLNAAGYPHGNPHMVKGLPHFNTGDWIGEVANMLGTTLEPGAQTNTTAQRWRDEIAGHLTEGAREEGRREGKREGLREARDICLVMDMGNLRIRECVETINRALLEKP